MNHACCGSETFTFDGLRDNRHPANPWLAQLSATFESVKEVLVDLDTGVRLPVCIYTKQKRRCRGQQEVDAAKNVSS